MGTWVLIKGIWYKRRAEGPNGLPGWKLEDARARFSELVRLARERGLQGVTVRGRDAVVVLSTDDHARLAPIAAGTSLAALFGEGPFARLDGFDDAVVRERTPRRGAPDFAPDIG